MNRTISAFTCSLPLLALVSCAPALRMTVSGPEDLSVVRDAHAPSRELPRYAARDSARSLDDGRVVVRGDTLIRLRVLHPSASLHLGAPTLYRFERVQRSIPIGAYVTTDGHRHVFPGQVRARGDSLEFIQAAVRARDLRRGFSGDTLWLARVQVARLEVEDPNPIGTAVGLTLAVSLLIVVMVIGAAYSGWTLGG